jgi:hypothetical protein
MELGQLRLGWTGLRSDRSLLVISRKRPFSAQVMTVVSLPCSGVCGFDFSFKGQGRDAFLATAKYLNAILLIANYSINMIKSLNCCKLTG